jgi:hypothetical protein
VAAQQAAYAYADRPYEIEAKQVASDVLGYTPATHSYAFKRPPPSVPLFDKRTDSEIQEYCFGDTTLNPRVTNGCFSHFPIWML